MASLSVCVCVQPHALLGDGRGARDAVTRVKESADESVHLTLSLSGPCEQTW